jgi:hypothetical protein
MEENTTEVTENADAQQDTNFSISVEQICAAMLSKLGTIEIPLETLVANYSDKVIAVDQDETTKALTFRLQDAPPAEENQNEVTE